MTLVSEKLTKLAPAAAEGTWFQPDTSVFVAANAGSGKTSLLTKRVLGLLLHGVLPGRILCLTFTKAAASEMAARVQKDLGDWVMLDDVSLAKKLSELTSTAPDSRMLARARGLFAKVLEAPDGVHIKTLHGFCQSLLQRFPLEAGVSPHFMLMDERSEEETMKEARLRLFSRIQEGNEEVQDAIRALAADSGEYILQDILTSIIKNKRKLVHLVTSEHDLKYTVDRLYKLLGCELDDTVAGYIEKILLYAPHRITTLQSICDLLHEQGKQDSLRTARGLQNWLASGRREQDVKTYIGTYWNKEGPYKKFCNKGALPENLEQQLNEEAERVLRLREKLCSLETAKRSGQVMLVAHSLLSLYQSLKESSARLDYDDLILYALRLLEQPGISPWVLFKLDGGIDHVLVDEAQDTSPEQWRIVKSITSDFFDGQGRSKNDRSIFIVGDEKQSIYRFQGADVAALGDMQDYFYKKIRDSGGRALRVSRIHSFRSVPEVLAAIDRVFANAVIRRHIMPKEGTLTHIPYHADRTGVVELWPLQSKEEGKASPQIRLIQQITDAIADWLQHGVSAGDIMILVRTRTAFVERLSRALKRRNIPVAGTDRMQLSDNLAVQDLVALGQCMLLPEDDLTLAAVLKSPIGGLSEEELFALAYERGDCTLWQRLQTSKVAGQTAKARVLLAELFGLADTLAPYEFYAHMLDTLGLRARFLGRMGAEYADPIDEFLIQALHYGRSHTPSMQGFLRWLSGSETEIKRDMEQQTNTVRIMTVHAAKGLQAPIVILPDTTGMPGTKSSPLWHKQSGMPLWASSVSDFSALCKAEYEDEKQHDYAEYCRQLYVAMTRAEERLYVCGAVNYKDTKPETWYSIVKSGLADVAAPFAMGNGEGLRLGRVPAPRKTTVKQADKNDWDFSFLQRALPPEPEPSRPLAPSHMADDDPAATSPLEDKTYSRGRLIHALLQHLPQVSPVDRQDRARRLAYTYAYQMTENEIESATQEAFAVLTHPDLAFLFMPEGLAEVPVTGTVDIRGRLVTVSGQIDRLVLDEDIWVIDYKTSRNPPQKVDDTPPAYLRQMALYRLLLAAMYPGKTIRTALVWTAAGRLTPIPPGLLDAAL